MTEVARFEMGEAVVVEVHRISSGFSVIVRDTEADEVLPSGFIFKTQAEATAKAERMAKGAR